MMSDIENLVTMAANVHEMVTPKVNVPVDVPQWARGMFPSLIKALYANVNKYLQNAIKDVIKDFNKSIEHLQSQMNTMAGKIDTQSQSHNVEISKLKESLKTKQYQVDNLATVISDLKNTIDKNESYSQRPDFR